MHDNVYIMVESKNHTNQNSVIMHSIVINLKDTYYLQCHYS